MNDMNTLTVAIIAFIAFTIGMPIVGSIARAIGLYTTVREGTRHVYVLFGNIIGTLDDPGLHILIRELGWRALIVNLFGKRHVLDMRMEQEYLRSQAVNSEEGAPMGIGVWYEMFVSDPEAYLFKNADPRGSLAANVSNSAVRCLSNMPLQEMLETRHKMSHTVREEVSPKSHEWGYQLGSVYIRKVHFRDEGMIKQIEAKVINRLRQVTSAIKQDGANQVSIITSTAERQAAVEFARAAAMRPSIVGAALQEIAEDPEVTEALFQIMETQNMVDGDKRLTLIPAGQSGLASLLTVLDRPAGAQPAAQVAKKKE